MKLSLALGCVLTTAAASLAACSGNDGADVGPAADPSPSGDDSAPSSSDAGGAAPTADAQPAPPPVDASPVNDDGPAPIVLPAPTHGVLMGAFVGVGAESEPASQSEALFTTAEGLIGRRWVIDNRFYSDNDDWTGERTQWDIAHGKVPLITWMPYHKLDDIIAGNDDALLHQRAQAAKALGAQILMRWAHEMNGNWYPWSGSNNGNAAGPPKYIAAWKHVHDLFVADGATNVVWVWCPLVADVPSDSWNHWTNYYPGDPYVDWVGLDAYNWGSSSSCCAWESFVDLVDAPYHDYAAKKPILLPETASAEVGGNKAAWIDSMHQAIEGQYPAIHGVVWFDINKETDWRIDSSPAALAAYKSMALDPYFHP